MRRPNNKGLKKTSSRGAVLQLMPLQGMAQLVVAEIQSGGRCPLVEAVASKRLLEELPLIVRNSRPEVAGRAGGGADCVTDAIGSVRLLVGRGERPAACERG